MTWILASDWPSTHTLLLTMAAVCCHKTPGTHTRHVVCAPHIPGVLEVMTEVMIEVCPPVLARYFRYLTLLSISLRHLS